MGRESYGTPGALHLTGRKKDIIIRSGVNLSKRKIKRAMLSIPGVAAAAVGLPDEFDGELPYAMAVACPMYRDGQGCEVSPWMPYLDRIVTIG